MGELRNRKRLSSSPEAFITLRETPYSVGDRKIVMVLLNQGDYGCLALLDKDKSIVDDSFTLLRRGLPSFRAGESLAALDQAALSVATPDRAVAHAHARFAIRGYGRAHRWRNRRVYASDLVITDDRIEKRHRPKKRKQVQ